MIPFKNKGNHRNEAGHEKSGFELSVLKERTLFNGINPARNATQNTFAYLHGRNLKHRTKRNQCLQNMWVMNFSGTYLGRLLSTHRSKTKCCQNEIAAN